MGAMGTDSPIFGLSMVTSQSWRPVPASRPSTCPSPVPRKRRPSEYATPRLTLRKVGGSARDWIQLFNGRDLADWTIKFAKHDLGENFANTFRVEDGLL